MADQAHELSLFDREVKILHNHRGTFGAGVNFGYSGQDNIIAHSTSTGSRLISRRRIGVLRREKGFRGMLRSSGSMSGRSSFFVTTVTGLPPGPSRKSSTLWRISLNRGSWLIALRSRGRGRFTGMEGPRVAFGPALSGMIRSASRIPSSTSLVIMTTVFL